MKAKELKKLTRTELLEMLLNQVEENEQLRMELNDAQKKLNERSVVMENSGSMAEAVLRLSGVFDNAQQAADDYLESIRLANSEPAEYARKVQEEATRRAEEILAEAERRSQRIHQEADEYWLHMRQKVQALLE